METCIFDELNCASLKFKTDLVKVTYVAGVIVGLKTILYHWQE